MDLNAEANWQLDKFAQPLQDLEQALELLGEVDVSTLSLLDSAQYHYGVAEVVLTLYNSIYRLRGKKNTSARFEKEVQRLQQYRKKVQKALSAEELRNNRPTATLNIAAANRFIDHAIPDLTTEQRQALKRASKEVSDKKNGTAVGPKKQKPNTAAKDAALAFLTALKAEATNAHSVTSLLAKEAQET